MILLALIDFNDGAEIIVMTFITPIIKAEWGLTSAKATTLISVVFFGAFLGLFFSGKIADIKGRHPSIKFSSIFYFTCYNLMAIGTNYE
jgi:MFS family permease